MMETDFLTLSDSLHRMSTSRVALRSVALSDAFPLFGATRNPLFNQHLLWAQPRSIEEVHARVEAIVDAHLKGRMSAVSAVIRDTGEWVALFRILPHVSDSEALEMGIWTHPKYWQGRISLEIGRLMMDATFLYSNTNRLIGAAAEQNRSSCALMQINGAVAERAVKRRTEDGVEIDLVEFVLTRERWNELRSMASIRRARSLSVFGVSAPEVVNEATSASAALVSLTNTARETD